MNTFFIATSRPLYRPLWIVLNPPIEIYSNISRSLKFIYITWSKSRLKEFLLSFFSRILIFSSSFSNYFTLFCSFLYWVSNSTIFPTALLSLTSLCSSSNQEGVDNEFYPISCPKHFLKAFCIFKDAYFCFRDSNCLLRGFPSKINACKFVSSRICCGKSERELPVRSITFKFLSSFIFSSRVMILLFDKFNISSLVRV